MKRFILILSVFFVVFTVSVYAENTASEWARESIENAISVNIVPSDLQQDYTKPITRKEFCSLIIKLLREQNPDLLNTDTNKISFSDTDSNEVKTAAALGIVTGVGNNKFNPDGNITRQEAARMLYNTMDTATSVLKDFKADKTNGVNGIFLPHCFNDGSKINNWARNEIYAMYHLGIMLGTDNNNFSPLESYTREQSISTFLRLYNAFEDISNNSLPDAELYPSFDSHICSSLNDYYVDAIWQWGSEDYVYEPLYYDGFGNVYTAKEIGYVYPTNKKYMKVLTGGPAGTGSALIIDKQKNEVTENCYDVNIINNDKAVINDYGNFYLYDLANKSKIKDIYPIKYAGCGMYEFCNDQLCGYMNSDFKEIIPAAYKAECPVQFLNDLAVLQKQDNSFIIVNTKGEILKTFKLDLNKYHISDIYGTNMILSDKNDNNILYRAYSGKMVTNYKNLRFSSNGDIIAQNSGKQYLLDKSGNLMADLSSLGYDNIQDNSCGFYIVNKIDKSSWSNILPADIMDYNGNIIRKDINNLNILTDYNGICAYKSSDDKITVFDTYGKDIGEIQTKGSISEFRFINGLICVSSEYEGTITEEYYTPSGEPAITNIGRRK